MDNENYTEVGTSRKQGSELGPDAAPILQLYGRSFINRATINLESSYSDERP